MAATADHVSGGRFGLNIVAGWYTGELSMFGLHQREHDERYEVADEWAEVLKQLWTVDGERDFHGALLRRARPACSSPSRCRSPTR